MRVAIAAVLIAALLGGAAAPARAGEPDATSPVYDVSLAGSDRGLRWAGRETVTITNPGVAPLDTIWIRLWATGDTAVAEGATSRSPTWTARRPASRACSAAPSPCGSPCRWPQASEDRSRSTSTSASPSGATASAARVAAWRCSRTPSPPWPTSRAAGGGSIGTSRWARLDLPGGRVDGPAGPLDGVLVAAPGVVQPDGSRRLERARDYLRAAGRLRRGRRRSTASP